ncbi:unnamed protein product [Notodromas monacha]|uniref:glutaminyl-peptide cyclotransferase n=1 Tax=Notodromas monacha TaxID=399045 RepID=A0A7R9BWX9_9CRUS|nr:unnamed protein product [Notodromas monacha]CAG0922907.1 unnamed protein product [Notodromas monacha]
MDSAVPCALLLSISETFSPSSQESNKLLRPETVDCVDGTTLQLIFFDGEEAVKAWVDGDKLYGSTALAELWETEGKLENIQLFILMDLLGTKVGYDCSLCPKIVSLYESTQGEYDQLVSMETFLRDSGQLLQMDDVDPAFNNATFMGNIFRPDSNYLVAGIISDDHTPFLNRGVQNILHLIPFPFPHGFHSEDDDEENLDPAAVLNLDLIIRCAICSNLTSISDLECGCT